jgi:hypothetical protein
MQISGCPNFNFIKLHLHLKPYLIMLLKFVIIYLLYIMKIIKITLQIVRMESNKELQEVLPHGM